MLKTITKIISFFDRDQKKYFYFLFIILLFLSLVETLSIGVFIPLITQFFSIEKSQFLNNFFSKLGLANTENIFTNEILIFFLLMIYVLRFFLILFCNWYNKSFEAEAAKFLTNKLYKKYLNLNYVDFIEKNSSIMAKNITSEIRVFIGALSATVYLYTEFFILLSIICFLLYLSFLTSTIIFIFLGLFAFFIHFIFNKKLSIWGKESQKTEGLITKNTIQSLSSIKEIKILHKENFFLERLNKFNSSFYESNKKARFIRTFPKLFIEIFLVIILVGILFIVNYSDLKTNEILPLVGVYLAAAYRVLPSLNRIIVQAQYIKFAAPVVDNLKNEYNQKEVNIINYEKNKSSNYLIFNDKIVLDKIVFKYPNHANPVLSNLTFKIKKNESIGIMGSSGAGKTTLINILIGLLKPSNGSILVDNKDITKKGLYNFRNLLSYVPQQTYLLDESLKNNIAFGIEEKFIDYEYLNNLINLFELTNLVKSSTDGINTIVGDKGAKLSGGQIQRIGLARAFYFKPEILILDEATNAIDEETEGKILNKINHNRQKFTVISIAHKKQSLMHCDKIFELNNQTLKLI
jgi:ABC-type multidrug transport system fused ATPase/permease subunit